MGKMKRLQKRLDMKPQAARKAIWAGETSELELELERKLAALDAKHERVGLTEAERVEGVRLHLDLIEESQRRCGVTLMKIKRNADDTSATYDMGNFYRLMRDVQILVNAGMPQSNAVARALEDERFRQQREAAETVGAVEAAEDLAAGRRGFFGSIKNFIHSSLDSLK